MISKAVLKLVKHVHIRFCWQESKNIEGIPRKQPIHQSHTYKTRRSPTYRPVREKVYLQDRGFIGSYEFRTFQIRLKF